jgi:hypothetical protein
MILPSCHTIQKLVRRIARRQWIRLESRASLTESHTRKLDSLPVQKTFNFGKMAQTVNNGEIIIQSRKCP